MHNTCRSRWIFYDFFTWRAPERLQRDFVVICRINLTSLKAKLRWRAEREVCLLTKNICIILIRWKPVDNAQCCTFLVRISRYKWEPERERNVHPKCATIGKSPLIFYAVVRYGKKDKSNELSLRKVYSCFFCLRSLKV